MTIRMTVLRMRTALAYQHKNEPGQQTTDFVGFENRDGTHDSRHGHALGAQKFRFEPWLAIFKQHGDNLP